MKTLFLGNSIDCMESILSRLGSGQERGSMSIESDFDMVGELLRVGAWELDHGRLGAADECIRLSLALEREGY